MTTKTGAKKPRPVVDKNTITITLVVKVTEGTDRSLDDIKAQLEADVQGLATQAGQGYGPPDYTVTSVTFK